jgi:hypothetical protein
VSISCFELFSAIFIHHTQLALYKDEHYLRPLQGDVLPWIIGVHVLPGVINVAMELPHHSFWIEASPDMPTILKTRCIEAFEKIHRRGVLHGDVELRHMLIGGDGKVTVVDFQMSRVLVLHDDFMLLAAEPWELKLEMRKVKYKLDYDGARKKETEKMIRSEERDQINGANLIEEKTAKGHGEDIPEEDIVDPPVHIRVWNESWANAAANATPTRFVVPGQSSDKLAKEVQTFLATIDRMAASPSLPQSPSERRPVRSPKMARTQSYGMRKRKRPEPSTSGGSSHEARSVKRFRHPYKAFTLSAYTDEDPDSLDPVLVEYIANDAFDKDGFTPPRKTTVDVSESLDVQPLNPSPRFPPIKVRDFAYEPYDGPRGYYAPYPLLEAASNDKRRKFVRLQKRQRYAELDLPLPRPSDIATPSGSISGTRKSKVDRHIMELTLGPGRQTAMESLPGAKQKRKRRSEETEWLEPDSDQRPRKVLTNTDRNVRLSTNIVPDSVGHPVARVPRRQAEPQEPQDHEMHRNKRDTNSDRIAFAALRTISPATTSRRAKLKTTRFPVASDTCHRSDALSVEQPTSEDEVEDLLDPSGMSDNRQSSSNSLESWMGLLFRWIK